MCIRDRGKDGACTVTTTMMIADMAGIRVFATGGIGGVHRGAETTMDISADLQELANTRVAVVCAGAKSLLDIPKTLESVSYTHLDVYKRQGKTLSSSIWLRWLAMLLAPLIMLSLKTEPLIILRILP